MNLRQWSGLRWALVIWSGLQSAAFGYEVGHLTPESPVFRASAMAYLIVWLIGVAVIAALVMTSRAIRSLVMRRRLARRLVLTSSVRRII